MKLNKILVSTLMSAAMVPVIALAQSQAPGRYHQRPGVMEFTGEMIVRPLQPSALIAKGLNPLQQYIVRSRAGQRVQAMAIDYVGATDEFVIKVPAGSNENKLSLELMKTGDFQ